MRSATERTCRLLSDAKTGEQDPVASFGYVADGVRGDHCLIDVGMVAIPSANEASVANPFDLFSDRDSARLAAENLIKPKSEWPPRSVLMSKSIFTGVKKGQYPLLVKKLLEANMVTLLPSGPDVIENSIFGVWKVPGVSQRLIWSGCRSNMLFNSSASGVDLPTMDIIGSFFLKPGARICVAGCDISQYHNRLQAPVGLLPFLGLPKVRPELLGLPVDYGVVTPCLT